MVDVASTAVIAVMYRGEGENIGSALGTLEACLSVSWVLGPCVGGTLAQARLLRALRFMPQSMC